MSSFGGRRKARVIKVDDADEPEAGSETTSQENGSTREYFAPPPREATLVLIPFCGFQKLTRHE